MRPEMIQLDKLEEGNPINKLRDSFNKQNEAILYHQDPIGIVFIGDSITDYWDLNSYFEIEGKRIINRGVGNDRTTYLKYRFAADALQLKPDYIVLSIGVNNTKKLDAHPDEETKNEVIAEVTTDIKALIEQSLDAGINIAITSVTSTNRPHLKSFELRAAAIKEINEILKSTAEHYQIPFINYYDHMTITGDIDILNPELTDDGLHPHVLGYDIMADVLVKSIGDAYPIKKRSQP